MCLGHGLPRQLRLGVPVALRERRINDEFALMTTLDEIAAAGRAAGWPGRVITLLGSDPAEAPSRATVVVIRNGPYLVIGPVGITDHLGVGVDHNGMTALCRCGQSATKPTCDAACLRAGFDDTKSPD